LGLFGICCDGEEYVEEGFVKVKGARLRFEGLSAMSARR
jgi:hypothetical protein